MVKHTQSYARRRGFSELVSEGARDYSGPVFTPIGIVHVRGSDVWVSLRLIVAGRQWNREIDGPAGQRRAVRAAYAFAREVAAAVPLLLKARGKR